jgi:hypothetical protein
MGALLYFGKLDHVAHVYMAQGRRRPQVLGVKLGRFSTALLVFVFLCSLGALLLVPRLPLRYAGRAYLADVSGFLALALIAATGLLMLLKKPLAAWMGSPELLWRTHIAIAGTGGLFLGLHVVIFLAFPLSLPVFFGYAATGAALFVWVTGGIYFQGIRNSIFYHGVFSMIGIFLMVLHTFGAGQNIPAELSGMSLAATAVAVIGGVVWRLARKGKGL